MEHWDLVVVGGGPAGLAAGIYAGRSKLKTVILEEKTPGGEAAITPLVENYPGFESITGIELVEKMVKHCEKFGAKINGLERVVSLDLDQKKKIAKTDKEEYTAAAMIAATGTHYRLLNVPGEKEFLGRGVSYCALCDGAFFKGKKVIVVGGGNSAASSAEYLSNIADKVVLVHRKDQLRAEEAYVDALKAQNVEFVWETELKEIKGNNIVKSVTLHNNKTGELREEEVDGVFVQVGVIPNSKLFKEAGIAVDRGGYIIVNSSQKTNVPGVFSAGDVTNLPVKQIGTAVGQGIIAATEAFGYIKRPYYYKGM
ncbi:MAG: thioredoxin-disulfide reductase [Candidatus Bathyarchaeota archaeon]|nr:thioredoxin-disulfide reductase [Candidatus Bathyarchaeota archaeon]